MLPCLGILWILVGNTALADDIPQVVAQTAGLSAGGTIIALLGSLLFNLVSITGALAAWLKMRQKQAEVESAKAEAAGASAPTHPSAITIQAEEIVALKQENKRLLEKVHTMEEEKKRRTEELRIGRTALVNLLEPLQTTVEQIQTDLRNSPLIERLISVTAESNEIQREMLREQRSQKNRGTS